MSDAIEKFLNELPTIAVGVWALLRVLGQDVDPGDQAAIVTGIESVGAVLLWLLVRRRTDGPVTLWHARKEPR